MNLDHVRSSLTPWTKTCFLAARNLPNVLVVEPRYADPVPGLYKKVLVTKAASNKLQEMFA